jgi:hypothetical protein
MASILRAGKSHTGLQNLQPDFSKLAYQTTRCHYPEDQNLQKLFTLCYIASSPGEIKACSVCFSFSFASLLKHAGFEHAVRASWKPVQNTLFTY